MTNSDASRTNDPTDWLSALLALGRAYFAMRASLRKTVAHDGLTISEAILLLAIAETSSAGITQSELVQQVAMSPAQVSGQLESLTQRTLASASRPAVDRRRQIWHVTPKGLVLTRKWRAQLPSNAPQRIPSELSGRCEDRDIETRRAA